MKPRALIYANSAEVESSLKKFLEGQDISVISTSQNTPSVNYFFAIISTKEDLNKIKPFLELDAKKVIALPYSIDKPEMEAKFVFFYELLTTKLNYLDGYASWVLASLKTKGSVYLPKTDTPIYPTALSELFKFMAREAFTYYKPGEVFVYHPTSLHKFAEWIARDETSLMVNIDPSLNFPQLDIDLNKYPTQYLTLPGDALRELYAKGTVHVDYLNLKVDEPKKRKTKIESGNIARLATLAVLVVGMPIYLYLFSLGFLYLGSRVASKNERLASFSFEMAGALAKTNSQVLGVTSTDNDLTESALLQINSSRIGKRVINKDYESLYKELAFSELGQAREKGVFSKMVNSVEIIPDSRQKILAISRANMIKDRLIGNQGEMNYLIIAINNNLAKEAKVVTVEKSKKTEEVFFSPEKIDQNIAGIVDIPEDVLDILETDSFEFKYVNLGEDFQKNAQMAAWFIEKSYDREVDVVVFVYEHELSIPENITTLDLESMFYGFKEGSLKAWSLDPEINSVLLDLNKLTAV